MFDSVRAGVFSRTSRFYSAALQLLPYIDLPITIEVEGAAARLGPSTVSLKGGATAFWIKAFDTIGVAKITVSSKRFPNQEIEVLVHNA